MKVNQLGQTGVNICPFVIGGHGVEGGFYGRPSLSLEDFAQILTYLARNGMTHFDYTFGKERAVFAKAIKLAGLEGKLKPIIWYMNQEKEEGRKEASLQDFIDNVKYHLDDLGVEQAGALIKWDNQWPKDWPAWTLDGIDRLKADGLVEATGIGVLAGARANESYLAETWQHWDFIAPYWNYSLRRAQNLVEFARERGMGVYSVGAFLRGAIFDWPGVQSEEIVRPWLKWILRESSCFGFALSVQSMDEAKQVVAACDEKPMSWEETQYFYEKNFPVQHVDYRTTAASSAASKLYALDGEEIKRYKGNTNMISGSMVKWFETSDKG